MAFTVEPASIADIEIIDLTEGNKNSIHYFPFFAKVFVATETVEKIFVFDPRMNKSLQILATSQSYSIDVTTTPGVTNKDITNAAVPWVSLKSSITADFLSGGNDINVGIVAVRVTSAVLTANFQVYAAQYGDDNQG